MCNNNIMIPGSDAVPFSSFSLKHFIEWVGKFSVNSLDDIKLDFIKNENISNEILPGGPPCLQDLLSQGALAEGGRNNGLFNIGVYLRKRYPEDWQEKELSWLAKKQLTLVAIMSVIQVTMLGFMLLFMYINSIIFK